MLTINKAKKNTFFPFYFFYRCYLLLSFFSLSSPAMATFDKNLWSKWVVYNPESTAIISHHAWQTFLSHHVVTNEDGINVVDYPHLTKADRALLDEYISTLSKIHIRDYNRDEQLAFWINLYNAIVVQTIARYYPVNSIQDINISPGLFSTGPWEANLVVIDKTELSLDEIQNRIIRPIWNDPRIHYALNDATMGCANLSKKIYQGHDIENQLNQAASHYINSLRGLQLVNNTLVVSKLYKWYFTDFGDTESDLLYHLQQYAKEPLRHHLHMVKAIDGYIYNWHLNSIIAHPS